jgi:hypothetical protein
MATAAQQFPATNRNPSRLLKYAAAFAFGIGVLAELVNVISGFISVVIPRFLMVSAPALIIFMLILFLLMRSAGQGGAPGPNGPWFFLAWAMAMLITVVSLLTLTSVFFEWPAKLVYAMPTDTRERQLDRLVGYAKQACLVGTQFNFSADLDGNVIFSNPTKLGEGEAAVNVRKSTGAAAIFDEKLRIIADRQVQDCMRPYIERIFNAILTSG